MRERAALIACGLVCFLAAPAAAAAQGSKAPPAPYVKPNAAHHLFSAPRVDARVVGDVPITLGGEPVILAVQGQAMGDSIPWLQVRFRSLTAWLPASDVSPASLPALTHGSAPRLAALLDRAGPSSGAEVSTLQGLILWSRRASAAHPLASNTKLFTAAAALARFGPSIAALLRRLLPPSDNALAQSLSDRLGDGSAALGAARAAAFAHRLGVDVALADGSGLSYANRGSPDAITRFLVALSAQPFFQTLYGALAVMGRSGTLEFRLRHTVADGRCSAKTGSLALTSNLSGFCRTLSGHLLVFSILVDHHSVYDARSLQDQMVDELVRAD